VGLEEEILACRGQVLPDDLLARAKQDGFADRYLAGLLDRPESDIRAQRKRLGIMEAWEPVPVSGVDEAAYYYSTYNAPDRVPVSDRRKIMVLGGGPNRIGQGIEFDYCCVHAAMAIRAAGYESIMVNCNPETVSTDYDTSDKLYFEPVTAEHVGAVLEREKPLGVILQFGGQTPLKLSHRIGPILGTSADAIDLCEDRERFNKLLGTLGIRQPEGAMVSSREEAIAAAVRIGFPLLVRPSYVLGGRAMAICHDEASFHAALDEALEVSDQHSVLMDRFLEGAVEYDVDALADGEEVHVAAIMEHIEEAGVHSGDSACSIPPVVLRPEHRDEMIDATVRIAKRLRVIGLVNVQFAVCDGEVYVIEVNPRASRTVPFVSKATGLALPAMATRLCLGEKLADLGPLTRNPPGMFFIKAPVFPWRRFTVKDVVLGPEMHSTGEVMGVGRSFGEAYAKALMGAGMKLPSEGAVFLSLRDADKHRLADIAGPLYSMGFKLLATGGTAAAIREAGLPVETVFKVREGRPDIVDHVRNGRVQLMINTPKGKKGLHDEAAMRLAGLRFGVPCITTLRAAEAVVSAIRALRAGELRAVKLQEPALRPVT